MSITQTGVMTSRNKLRVSVSENALSGTNENGNSVNTRAF